LHRHQPDHFNAAKRIKRINERSPKSRNAMGKIAVETIREASARSLAAVNPAKKGTKGKHNKHDDGGRFDDSENVFHLIKTFCAKQDNGNGKGCVNGGQYP